MDKEYQRLILITIDCLRKDCLDKNGEKVIPNITKFSKNAIIFEKAISNGASTSPAFYSLFTSKIPTSDGPYTPLKPNMDTFVKILKENRIKTCGIHSNPHLGKNNNYHKGFDYFFDFFRSPPRSSSHKKNIIKKIHQILKFFKINEFILKIGNRFLRKTKFSSKNKTFEIKNFKSPYSDAKSIVVEAIRWLNKNYNKDFFLWIHFMDAHRPNYPQDKFIKKISEIEISLRKKKYLHEMGKKIKVNPEIAETLDENDKKLIKVLYNAELNYVDHYFGIFVKFLRNLNIYNKIDFILTSDHGEFLLEHNLLEHTAALYEEVLRIPLILKLNNVKPPRYKIEDQVQIIDLAPTILDLFNLPIDKSFEGKSIIPLIEGAETYQHPKYAICATLHNRHVVYTIYNKFHARYYLLIACRSNNWKLIYDDQERRFQFFNLKKDPYEQKDLAGKKEEEIVYVKNIFKNVLEPFISQYSSEEVKIKQSIEKNITKLKNI
ncbi:MAG: sulfatase-like hydrolase/transferase [Promethearchaeota archaeon]